MSRRTTVDRGPSLFERAERHDPEGTVPLADRVRPKALAEMCWHLELLGAEGSLAQAIADDLRGHGFSSLALHGDLEQRDRDQTLVRFSNKSISVLVATDVAARGLDIDELDAVINYHIARDPEMHVHRIGRTGRAGSKGTAYSLISEKESYKVALLQVARDTL